jgi:hypothetical protein
VFARVNQFASLGRVKITVKVVTLREKEGGDKEVTCNEPRLGNNMGVKKSPVTSQDWDIIR